MGEFSAGKSTLTNLLLGEGALPVQVTATQLPPVWIAHGNHAPFQVDMDGVKSPVDLNDPAGISVHDVQYVRVFHEAEVLEMCELIDMPGISDPNMPADMWERVADEVDGVIWCTHASQAWRQSEDALWSTLPPELYAKSLLLITRFDKITEERDRKRLVARVTRETEDLFRGVFPISLTEALEAGGDDALWEASGADAFARALMDLTQGLANPSHRWSGAAGEGAAPAQDVPTFRPGGHAPTPPAEPEPELPPGVMPTRTNPKPAPTISALSPPPPRGENPGHPIPH